MNIIDRASQIIHDDGIGVDHTDCHQTARALDEAGVLADEHHSIQELYDYRMAYNALTFNLWAKLGLYDVHKSWRHSDGEECFGGGWFIVCATTPHGLVSNHYPAEAWGLFAMEHRELPLEFDGHTPQEALARLLATANDQKYTELP